MCNLDLCRGRKVSPPSLTAPAESHEQQLSEKDIRDFQEIWQAEFGEAISADYARHSPEAHEITARALGERHQPIEDRRVEFEAEIPRLQAEIVCALD